MKHARRCTIITGGVLSLSLVMVGTSPAGEIEGVQYAESYRAGDTTLVLKGVGLARFLLSLKVYVGALYLPEGVKAEDALSDVPKRLELQYFRPIEGPDFGKAAEQVMADNVPASVIALLRPRISRLHALYENVKPGDRYALTYIPGVGTELALNGKSKGTIEGADFAAAYFAIWLGPNPINAPLKSQLLATR